MKVVVKNFNKEEYIVFIEESSSYRLRSAREKVVSMNLLQKTAVKKFLALMEKDKDREDKKEYLKRLEQELKHKGDIMPVFDRNNLKNVINDLRNEIETPVDKMQKIEKDMAVLQKRANIFDKESMDYKIILQSVERYTRHMKALQEKITADMQYRRKLQESMKLEITKEKLIDVHTFEDKLVTNK
jgi:hypothetical protein